MQWIIKKYIETAFAVSIYFAWGCNSTTAKPIVQQDLSAVALGVQYPYVDGANGRLSYLKDTITIYRYKNLILSKLIKSRNLETNEKVEGSEQFFIYKKGNNKGFLYYPEKQAWQDELFSVDSLLQKRAFAATNFEPLPDSLWGKYSIPSRSAEQQQVTEIYFLKRDYGPTAFDSVYYIYDERLNKLDYTLSRILDSSRGKKLVKVRLLFNEKKSAQYHITVPKREFVFEIYQPLIPDSKEIIDFFNRFINTHLKYIHEDTVN